ncbi:hypothetical protein H696_02210 [Fonticula alba]|uniref:Sas10 C-terminal domain-containing protein n=1 Tax=Fonticula alba TaxID=691883 RepID=A0A058ZBG5_FONAL|nr:hypothetical protein H696_02210 [Fonticula alba]KCV71263.1 hypothetical protein H696_02210 [Fonticula alba]|eukprot:XP_009494386.1 hypothetical protein H696_02210 [Fonticula alba]
MSMIAPARKAGSHGNRRAQMAAALAEAASKSAVPSLPSFSAPASKSDKPGAKRLSSADIVAKSATGAAASSKGPAPTTKKRALPTAAGADGMHGASERKRLRAAHMRQQLAKQQVEDEADAPAGAVQDSLAYYQEIATAAAARRAARAAVKGESAPEDAANVIGSKRLLEKSIISNRGLTPKRNKLLKNPRVKRRIRFEQAKIKLKSAGHKSWQPELNPYEGEVTGIKDYNVRSVKFN